MSEQECLGIVYALKQFRHYLLGVKFTLITDHNALKWLMSHQSPNGRLNRWALSLQEYDFEIQYGPGAINHTADALSRAPLVGMVIESTVISLTELKEAQNADPEQKAILLSYIQEGILPADPANAENAAEELPDSAAPQEDSDDEV